MATPLTAQQFIDALVAEGLVVVEEPGWRTHTRTSPSRPWGPVHGVLIHHTVTRGTFNTVQICRNGYAGLPGPLCHGVIAKDGRVHLVGYGRTNHAGGGDPDVLEAIKSEDYEGTPPKPNVGNMDGIDGNRHFYGFECENMGDGKDPWPDVQLEAIERASAALCRVHKWGAKSVAGHKEWSDDKTDPRGFSMVEMRDRVSERLGDEPGPETPPPPPKPPVPQYEPFPGASWFVRGRKDPRVLAMRKRLIANGCNRYKSESNPDVIGQGDVDSYEAWQRKCGHTGTAATWPPGKSTWDKLKVPNV